MKIQPLEAEDQRKSEREHEVAQSCPTLRDPMDCSLPGSSVHGIFQARVLEWIAISISKGSSQPRDRTWVSHIVDRRFTVSGQCLRWQSLPGTNTALVQPWEWRPPEILNCVYSGHACLSALTHAHTRPVIPKPIWWQIYEVRHPKKLPLTQKYALPWASLVAQSVKNLPAVQERWVRSLGWEDPLEKEMATCSSILTWKISWTEEPGGLQSMGSQRVGHDWASNTYLLMLCL